MLLLCVSTESHTQLVTVLFLLVFISAVALHVLKSLIMLKGVSCLELEHEDWSPLFLLFHCVQSLLNVMASCCCCFVCVAIEECDAAPLPPPLAPPCPSRSGGYTTSNACISRSVLQERKEKKSLCR